MQLLHEEMLVYFHYTILLPNKVGGPLKTHKRKEIIMAIIDSVRKLAEKVGADTNGRDIADQLNIINKHLDNTQPGSRDIAEAVSKFADKEDGTAILTTKTITENGTYTALDDDLDGYSSVTVDVDTSFNSVVVPNITAGQDYFGKVAVYRSSNGEYTPPYDQGDPLLITLVDPVKKVIAGAPGMTITFTPDEDFDGFYSTNGNKLPYTGDEVTPGDGYTYRFIASMGGNTMKKWTTNFTVTIS